VLRACPNNTACGHTLSTCETICSLQPYLRPAVGGMVKAILSSGNYARASRLGVITYSDAGCPGTKPAKGPLQNAVSDRAFVVRWHLSSIAAANRDLPMAASPDSRTTWSSPLLALDQRRNRNSSSSSRPTSCVRLLECRASKRLSTDDGLTAAQALTGPEISFRSCAPVKGLLRRVFATAPASDAKSLGFLSRLWRPPTSVFASLAVYPARSSVFTGDAHDKGSPPPWAFSDKFRSSRLPRSKLPVFALPGGGQARTHSIEFKRQVAQDFIAGETLGPACGRSVRVRRCFVLLKKIGCAGILIKCPASSRNDSAGHTRRYSPVSSSPRVSHR
jgi:hypothetical protein